MSDDELVARARGGDATAFGDLVDRHRRAVYRAALAALGSEREAEDVAQDAFLSAYRKLPSFRGDSSFKTWLLTIAWRKALSRRRSLAAHWRRLASRQPAEKAPGPFALVGPQESRLLEAERLALVRRLVRSLPAELRDTLLLFASGDYTYEELAMTLEVPAGTLKWRVAEARRRLRQKLVSLGFADE